MHIRIALAQVHPCTKFGGPRSKGVLARGHKAEKKQNCPRGAQFWPFGADSPNGTQLRPRRFWPESLGSRPLPVWARALITFFEGFTRRHVPRATWHVAPRDRRHRRSAVPAHRTSRLSSGSAQPFRRYSRKPCAHSHPLTPDPTSSARSF